MHRSPAPHHLSYLDKYVATQGELYVINLKLSRMNTYMNSRSSRSGVRLH
jgi:hypothetical protein